MGIVTVLFGPFISCCHCLPHPFLPVRPGNTTPHTPAIGCTQKPILAFLFEARQHGCRPGDRRLPAQLLTPPLPSSLAPLPASSAQASCRPRALPAPPLRLLCLFSCEPKN